MKWEKNEGDGWEGKKETRAEEKMRIEKLQGNTLEVCLGLNI